VADDGAAKLIPTTNDHGYGSEKSGGEFLASRSINAKTKTLESRYKALQV
jgi:hypothetical protein